MCSGRVYSLKTWSRSAPAEPALEVRKDVTSDPVLQALSTFWRRPVMIQILSCTFLQTSILGFFMGAGAWYNLQEYGFAAWQNGLLVAVGGGAMLFFQFNVTGPAVRVLTELGCIWLSSCLRCVSMLAYALAPPSTDPADPLPYLCVTTLMVTMALVDPSLQTLTMQVSPPKSLGTIMGIAQALRSAGEAVGPALAGCAYQKSHSLPWFMAALCAVLGGVLYIDGGLKAGKAWGGSLEEALVTSCEHSP